MDFSNLEGVINDVLLWPGKDYLRRTSIYIMFANSKNLETLYTNLLLRIHRYMNECIVEDTFDEDILYYYKRGIPFEADRQELPPLNVIVEQYQWPLFPSIEIASNLKLSYQAVTKMKRIGYQHLYVTSLRMVDSSESDDTTDDEHVDSDDGVPMKKKLRQCHRKTVVDNQSLVQAHIKNVTKTSRTLMHVDILIFMDEEYSHQLANYLGLIWAESLLKKVNRNIVDSIITGYDHETLRIFKVLRSNYNKALIIGCNNICIVNHLSLWEVFKANVRAVITTDHTDLKFIEAVETTNIHVRLNKNDLSLLHYVEAVAGIVSKALNAETHVIARYQCPNNRYRKVKVPLISVIPLYVLRYFRHCAIFAKDESNVN